MCRSHVWSRGFTKVKERGALMTLHKVKKKKPEKKERTYLFVRSGTVCSAWPVRPGSISKKKERGR